MSFGWEYVEKQCPTCGVRYALDKLYSDHRLNGAKEDDGRPLGWYCPNGHRLVYRESEADKLRRERDRLQQQIACKDDELTAKARQIKRLEKRASAGTCPCCTRTFTNMARHMKTKHPEFVAENVVKLKRA